MNITSNLTSIGRDAFNNCKNLTSILIPYSINSIGFKAFYGCESLTSITIPSGVTKINVMTFTKCISLKTMNQSEPVVNKILKKIEFSKFSLFLSFSLVYEM